MVIFAAIYDIDEDYRLGHQFVKHYHSSLVILSGFGGARHATAS